MKLTRAHRNVEVRWTTWLTPFEIAHQIGLIPLAWVFSLRAGGKPHDIRWRRLALAWGVSWLADWASHVTGTFPVGPLYLVGQGAIVVWALAPHEPAWQFLVVLIATANFAYLSLDVRQPDVLMHTVAWLGLLAAVWSYPLIPQLRGVLVVAFGVGLLAWWAYCWKPGWPTWLTYQGVRLAGVLGFCWASWRPTPLVPVR